MRKEKKKNPGGKSLKSRMIQIPNICPFKEDILKEAEEAKQHQEQQRLKRREAAQEERRTKKETSLAALVASAEQRGEMHGILNEGADANTGDIVSVHKKTYTQQHLLTRGLINVRRKTTRATRSRTPR